MPLLETIEDDLKQALRQKDTFVVSALRMLKSRITQEKKSADQTPSDAEILAVIKSQIKRHKESFEAFINAGRDAQADEEKAQMEALKKYVPEQMPEEEVQKIIITKIAENNWEAKDFGVAMKTLKTEFGDSVDGGVLSSALKAALQK